MSISTPPNAATLIREHLEANQMTVRRLADEARVSHTLLNKILARQQRVTYSTARKLATVMNVVWYDLCEE